MKITFEKTQAIYVLKLALAIFALVGISREFSREVVSFAYPARYDVSLSEELGTKERSPMVTEDISGVSFFTDPAQVFSRLAERIAQGGDFLYIDIPLAYVALYRRGKEQARFPVLSSGEAGSVYEVPNGEYLLRLKKKTHVVRGSNLAVSSAIFFSGNYMIHGPAQGSQSAPGILLGSREAKAVFDFAKTGMPVLANAGISGISVERRYLPKNGSFRTTVSLPTPSVLVADIETGEIFFEKDKIGKRPIASITKFVTALVALERIPRLSPLTIDRASLNAYGKNGGLREGETLKIEDFMYPLILASSNDVASLFEKQVPHFVDLMNEKARALGMAHTFFKDSSGLSPENVSTAEDLFTLLAHIYKNQQPLFWISSLKEYAVISGKTKHAWTNINWPRNDERFLGGKMGYTDEAFQTMAGVYKVRMSEFGERAIAIILLGSQNRVSDVGAIISSLEKNYVYGTVLVKEKQKPDKRENGRSGAHIREAFIGAR